MKTGTSRWETLDRSPNEALRFAGWVLGLTLALTCLGIVLDKILGPNLMIQALLHSAVFVAVTVSLRQILFSSSSAKSNLGWTLLSVTAWYLLFLGLGALFSGV